MKKYLISISILLLSFVSMPAFAEHIANGVFIGGSVGQSDGQLQNSDFTSTVTVDNDGVGGKVFSGYKFNRFTAIEADYLMFGRIQVKDSSGNESAARVRAISLDFIGILPVFNHFAVFGRIGVFRDDKDFANSLTETLGYSHTTGNMYGIGYGAGVQYDFMNNIGLRAEWQTIDNGAVDNSLSTLGILYTFPPY